MKLIIITASVLTLMAGCATQHVKLSETKPDGSKTESDMLTRTFWDSNNSLTKAKTSIGKTQSIGVYGLDQETTSTNMPATIGSVGNLIGTAVRSFVAPTP